VSEGGFASIGEAILRMIIYFALAGGLGLLLMRTGIPVIQKLPVSEPVLAFTLIMALFYAWSAETIGKVAGITGAYIAGRGTLRVKSKGELTPQQLREVHEAVHGLSGLTIVAQGRGILPADGLKTVADGRVLTGPQALDMGLVDQIGYLDDAIAIATAAAGLKEARVVVYARPGTYRHNIYSEWQGLGSLEALARLDVMGLVRGGGPQFFYLWMP